MIKSSISNSGEILITQCIKDSSPGSFLAKNAYLKPNSEEIIFQVHNVSSYIRKFAVFSSDPLPQKINIRKNSNHYTAVWLSTKEGGHAICFPRFVPYSANY